MSYFDDNYLENGEGYPNIKPRNLPKGKKKPRLKNPNEVVEQKPTKASLFTRGYGEVRQKVEKGSRFTMSCYNCDFYYQASGDKEEVCQNPDVLKYDMVITETSIYCNRWKLCRRTQSVKSIFKNKR